jgi:DNA-binding beta-propeller fold protein YncE
LAAVHSLGLVHRDVKPSNILLERGTGRVKIMDFGLAFAADEVRLTQAGIVSGTPLYMSPEQAQGLPLGPGSDLFSLGSVLYKLCTGQPAFLASTPLAVLKRVSDDAPSPIRQVNPAIPEEVVALINRLLAKDPVQRFQSAAEVADLLEQQIVQVQRQQRNGTPTAAPTRQAALSRAAARRRKFLAAGSATLLLLLGAGITAIFLCPPFRGPEASGEANSSLQKRPEPGIPDPFPPTQSQVAANDAANVVPVVAALSVAGGSFRHQVRIANCVAYSPDGKLLASSATTWDDTERRFTAWEVKIWETASGKLVREIKGHADGVQSVAFSHDGKRLATASRDTTATVWEVETGNEIFTLKGHTHSCRSLAFSPNGKLIATGGFDARVILWNAADGSRWLTLTHHLGPVDQVIFSADSTRVASTAYDQTVRVCDTATGDQINSLPSHNNLDRSVAFSPDGQRVVVNTREFATQVFDVSTGNRVLDLSCEGHTVHGLAWSPNGKYIATAGTTGQVKIWDAASGRELHAWGNHPGWMIYVAFRPDSQQLAYCGVDAQVRLWDMAAAKQVFPAEGQ